MCWLAHILVGLRSKATPLHEETKEVVAVLPLCVVQLGVPSNAFFGGFSPLWALLERVMGSATGKQREPDQRIPHYIRRYVARKSPG